MFGSNPPAGSGLFGLAKPQAPSGGLFAATPAPSAAAAPVAQSGTSSFIDSLNPPRPGLLAGFGQSTQPQQSGGLFSALGASSQAPASGNLGASAQPQQSGGLFASMGASQPQQPGGLFASMSASQPQKSGGLFASMGASQPQQPGGLFASMGASQPQQPGGLFASMGASQPQQPGGLFAIMAASQSAVQQSQQQGGQHAPKQSAYFEQMVERGKKRNNMENGGLGELPRLQLGLADIARKARNLGTGGPSAAEARADDTRAHYLLAASGVSTASALRDLNNFSVQAGAPVGRDSAAPDNDIDNFVSNLRAQSTMEMIQEGLDQSKRDFDNFLEENVQINWDGQRKKIYEHFGLAKPTEDLGQSAAAPAQSQRSTFGRSSRRNRGLGGSAAGMAFGASGMQKSILGNSAMRASFRGNNLAEGGETTPAANSQHSLEDRSHRERQEKYASKIKELNEARNQELCYPILHSFIEVESEAGDQNAQPLINSYKALIAVVGELAETLPRGNNAVRSRERQFADDYLNDNLNAPGSINMRKLIINGSRTCLEKMFWSKIEATISKDPRVANLGGIPQPINKVRAYIRVLTQRKALIIPNTKDVDMESLQKIANGEEADYCWVLIFFLLRCGLFTEAAQYVHDNQKAIRNLDRNFNKYLERYVADPDHRLPADLRQPIQSEYHAKTHINPQHQTDPYKIACYKIIGRCELSRKVLEHVTGDEADWVWLLFSLAREVNRLEETAGESFGLHQLQDLIKDVGQRYYAQGAESPGGYGSYFLLQILSGMFEPAVSWLYGHNHVAAVHVGIALSYYGLLRVSDLSPGELLSYTTRQQPCLRFAIMVGYYTGDFRAARSEVATDYLILLSLNADLPGEAGARQAEACREALRELVLETREFAQLLGDIRNDGQRVPGAIQQRANLIRRRGAAGADSVEEFIKALTIQAALAADEGGRTTDAVLLYHLASEYENVLSIVNRTLSEALTIDPGQEAMRLEPLRPRNVEGQQNQHQNSTLSLTSVDDPVVLARNMRDLYNGPVHQGAQNKIKRVTREATEVLLLMANAKALLVSGSYIQCIDVIGNIDLLPLNTRSNITVIRKYAQNLNDLTPVVARVVGDLLIWAVAACNAEKKRLTKDGWEVDARREVVENYARAIADLGVFAGLVRYKLRQGVFEILARAAEGL